MKEFADVSACKIVIYLTIEPAWTMFACYHRRTSSLLPVYHYLNQALKVIVNTYVLEVVQTPTLERKCKPIMFSEFMLLSEKR